MASMNQYLQKVNGRQSQTCYSISRMYAIIGSLNLNQPNHGAQRGETDFFSGDPLRALSTLVFSDNVDLQRSASLTFAEITERGMPSAFPESGTSGIGVVRQSQPMMMDHVISASKIR